MITALIGAELGVPLGVLLTALGSRALADEGVVLRSSPFVEIAAMAGILAAVLPARRAERLQILDALQHE